jgi:hypothetical protein
MKFQKEVYCGGVSVEHTIDGMTTKVEEGWIAINISDEELARYNGKNVKVIVEVMDE